MTSEESSSEEKAEKYQFKLGCSRRKSFHLWPYVTSPTKNSTIPGADVDRQPLWCCHCWMLRRPFWNRVCLGACRTSFFWDTLRYFSKKIGWFFCTWHLIRISQKKRTTVPKKALVKGFFENMVTKAWKGGSFSTRVCHCNTLELPVTDPGCNRHHQDDEPFLVGNSLLNLHLWLESWVKQYTNLEVPRGWFGEHQCDQLPVQLRQRRFFSQQKLTWQWKNNHLKMYLCISY